MKNAKSCISDCSEWQVQEIVGMKIRSGWRYREREREREREWERKRESNTMQVTVQNETKGWVHFLHIDTS